jgi:hypothetical protein
MRDIRECLIADALICICRCADLHLSVSAHPKGSHARAYGILLGIR